MLGYVAVVMLLYIHTICTCELRFFTEALVLEDPGASGVPAPSLWHMEGKERPRFRPGVHFLQLLVDESYGGLSDYDGSVHVLSLQIGVSDFSCCFR